MFYCSSLFFSTRNLRGPLADRREILRHVQFYNVGRILGGLPSKKFVGENHANFGPISDPFSL